MSIFCLLKKGIVLTEMDSRDEVQALRGYLQASHPENQYEIMEQEEPGE